jgi:hypothetical protein
MFTPNPISHGLIKLSTVLTNTPQAVGGQNLRHEVKFLEGLAHQFERRCLMPLGLDQGFQNLSFAIDGAPEIDQASIDLQIDRPRRDVISDSVRSWWMVAQICSDPWPEMIDPSSSHGLMRDHDPAFRQQIFGVAKPN